MRMKKALLAAILVASVLLISSCTGLLSVFWNITGLWDVLLDTSSNTAINDYQVVELNLTKTGNDITGNATVTGKNEVTNQVTGKATSTSLHVEIVTPTATITLDGTTTASDEMMGKYLVDTGTSTYTGDWRGNKR